MDFRLHYSLVASDGAMPRAWMLALHGILGSGANLRGLARRVVERRPAWGIALVDLRMHARSQGAPPPHTVVHAALDLARLADELRGAGRPVRAVLGHSFGGKVALAYRASRPEGLLDTWVLDASPSARPDLRNDPDPDGAFQVLTRLSSLPRVYERREELISALIASGVSPDVAAWVAQNLERDGPRFVLRLDLSAIRELLEDYATRDLWDAVTDPSLPGLVHFVIGGRSSTVSPADRKRLAAAGAAVRSYVLPNASHWVHVDAMDDLVARIEAELPEP